MKIKTTDVDGLAALIASIPASGSGGGSGSTVINGGYTAIANATAAATTPQQNSTDILIPGLTITKTFDAGNYLIEFDLLNTRDAAGGNRIFLYVDGALVDNGPTNFGFHTVDVESSYSFGSGSLVVDLAAGSHTIELHTGDYGALANTTWYDRNMRISKWAVASALTGSAGSGGDATLVGDGPVFASCVFHTGATGADSANPGTTFTPMQVIHGKNVSSVTSMGTGLYKINFTTPAADPYSYVPSAMARYNVQTGEAMVFAGLERQNDLVGATGPVDENFCIIRMSPTNYDAEFVYFTALYADGGQLSVTGGGSSGSGGGNPTNIVSKGRINFGTDGTMTIVGGVNVASVVRRDVGLYTINYASPVPAGCVSRLVGKFGTVSQNTAMVVAADRTMVDTTTVAYFEVTVGGTNLYDPYDSSHPDAYVYFEIVDPSVDVTKSVGGGGSDATALETFKAPTLIQPAVFARTKNASGTLTLAKAPTAGNTLVLLWTGAGSSVPAAPAGWAESYVDASGNSTVTGPNQTFQGFAAYTRMADGTEGTAITAPGGNDMNNWALFEFDRIDSYSFLPQQPVTTATTFAVPFLAGGFAEGYNLVLFEGDGGSDWTVTPPAGASVLNLFSEVADGNNHPAALVHLTDTFSGVVTGTLTAAMTYPWSMSISFGKKAAISVSAGSGGKAWDFNPPKVADFPTIFQSAAVRMIATDDADVGMYIQTDQGVTSDEPRGWMKTIPHPALDWQVVMRLNAKGHPRASGSSAGYSEAGFHLGLSTSAHIVTWAIDARSTMGWSYFEKPSGFGGSQSFWNWIDNDSWWKVRHDATAATIIWSSSPDGKNWYDVWTKPDTDRFGAVPDQIGPGFVVHNGDGRDLAMTIPYWVESGPGFAA